MNHLLAFPYKHIVVLGLARSGTMAAEVLLKNNIQVTVTDQQGKETDEEIVHLKALGATVVLGKHPFTLLDKADLIVKNPGIPYEIPFLQEAIERKIPIITEIELSSYLIRSEQLISVTGTNGKTTTTTLIGEMFHADHKAVRVAGNIGVVSVEEARTLEETETLLLELSSFQLMGIEKFRPHIAVILNIHEAHIDYHGTVEAYVEAKKRITKNQLETDYIVFNADDPTTVITVAEGKGIRVPFSLTNKLDNGGWKDDSYLYYKDEKVMAIDDIVLVGQHNLANILAAICVAKLQGINSTSIQKVLSTFQGVEHRLQYVTRIENRLFYNDSKATNTLATQTALRSFTRPVIWIAGGLDRGNDVSDLLEEMTYVKGMVVIGQSANKFYDLGLQANIQHIEKVNSMDEAVQAAYKMSNRNDIILLSPACASWDQYKTYEDRGNMFIQAVHNLL